MAQGHGQPPTPTPPFQSPVVARVHAKPSLQPSLLWLSPSLQFTSENGTQACPSLTSALPP